MATNTFQTEIHKTKKDVASGDYSTDSVVCENDPISKSGSEEIEELCKN